MPVQKIFLFSQYLKQRGVFAFEHYGEKFQPVLLFSGPKLF